MPCLYSWSWSLYPILLDDLESPAPSKSFWLILLFWQQACQDPWKFCHDDLRSHSRPSTYSKVCKNQDVRLKKLLKRRKNNPKMHSIPCVVGKSSSMTHTKQDVAGSLSQVNGWILVYSAPKTARRWAPACCLHTQQDRAKTPKKNLLDPKCFMQQEAKLKFQTVAKKCGWIIENNDAADHCLATVILPEAQLQSPSR